MIPYLVKIDGETVGGFYTLNPASDQKIQEVKSAFSETRMIDISKIEVMKR